MALLGLYGARIEATRRSLPSRAVAAAVLALIDERRAALRALTWQKQAVQRALKERRMAERFSARLAGRGKVPEAILTKVAGQEEARPS